MRSRSLPLQTVWGGKARGLMRRTACELTAAVCTSLCGGTGGVQADHLRCGRLHWRPAHGQRHHGALAYAQGAARPCTTAAFRAATTTGSGGGGGGGGGSILCSGRARSLNVLRLGGWHCWPPGGVDAQVLRLARAGPLITRLTANSTVHSSYITAFEFFLCAPPPPMP